MGKQAIASIDDLRRRARARIPRQVFDFIDGGSGSEQTLRANVAAFAAQTLRPRVLVNVAQRDASVRMFGDVFALPILLAPVGLARMAWNPGEIAAARTATAAGTVSVVSTASSVAIGDVNASVSRPQWFQLYPWGDRGKVAVLIDRARLAGCTTMVVTVDTPVASVRVRDVRNRTHIPMPMRGPHSAAILARHPAWWLDQRLHGRVYNANFEDLFGVLPSSRTPGARHKALMNPAHTWADLRWIRDQWEGALLAKGVMSASDAERAFDAGCDGVVVSNHGGRQCDGVPATLEVLPEVVDAVGQRGPVLIDGGVRSGVDVIKAVSLGATACMIGRAWMYGLAALGASGPTVALELLRDELDRTMALLGARNLEELRAVTLTATTRSKCVRPRGVADGSQR